MSTPDKNTQHSQADFKECSTHGDYCSACWPAGCPHCHADQGENLTIKHSTESEQAEFGKDTDTEPSSLDPLQILIAGSPAQKVYQQDYEAGRANNILEDWEKKFNARFQVVYRNGQEKVRLTRNVKDLKDFIRSLMTRND